ncbi:hypothetical protein H0I23_05605 [Cellulophaga sp. HaHaR_3_176]|uniref:hypothetical protein n=1 Tax=Cellulophaga sp. HaHaR_3_176 TaxID=1942464 RepID=UPI001C2007EB|nr:hypothetical protein [Cellulophaga sp. HaHaR_3_176]QWX85112.1 hypothetical protein H0I23_05605 [Cellulophaga sp. HaHaR_3_176]
MKRIPLMLVLGLVFVSSCSDETTVFEKSDDNLFLENNQNLLIESVNFENAGVLDINLESQLLGKTSKAGGELAGDYPLSLVAQITPPSFQGGENLTASHVFLDNNIAYVSYNTVEDGFAGGVDAIDISDPHNPYILSRLYYSNADINAVGYKDGYIYAVGGVDSEQSVTATSNSFLAKISAPSGRIDVSAGIVYGFQEGYVGTDIAVNDNIYVTSGKDGTLSVYDANTVENIKEMPFSDLRSVAIDNNRIGVLDASAGVSVFDENFVLLKEISITSDFGEVSKRTIDFSGDRVIVAEGSKGAGVYSTTTGALLEYIPIMINPEGSDSQDNVTNAIAVNEEVILMANGGAGLSLSKEEGDSSSPVGVLDLDGSINYVISNGDYIFAASGTAGLQIIKMNKPSESLENRCSELTNYNGSSNLNVNSGEVIEYKGSKRLSSINVGGQLLLCGSWSVQENTTINEDGLFELNGYIIVGRNSKRRDVIINSNAKLRVEGRLIIYGDLILNDGASLEFIGSDSDVYVRGSVIKSESATITGEYRDLNNKF